MGARQDSGIVKVQTSRMCQGRQQTMKEPLSLAIFAEVWSKTCLFASLLFPFLLSPQNSIPSILFTRSRFSLPSRYKLTSSKPPNKTTLHILQNSSKLRPRYPGKKKKKRIDPLVSCHTFVPLDAYRRRRIVLNKVSPSKVLFNKALRGTEKSPRQTVSIIATFCFIPAFKIC